MGTRFNQVIRDNPNWKGGTRVKGAMKEYARQRRILLDSQKEAEEPVDSGGQHAADIARGDGLIGDERLTSSGTGEAGDTVEPVAEVRGAGGDRPRVPNKAKNRPMGAKKKVGRPAKKASR